MTSTGDCRGACTTRSFGLSDLATWGRERALLGWADLHAKNLIYYNDMINGWGGACMYHNSDWSLLYIESGL